MIDRRSFLKLVLAAQAFAVSPSRASIPGLRMGEAHPFSYDWLKARAEALAAAAYVSPPRPDPKIVSSIDYDAHGQLHYKSEYALYGDGDSSAFPITFQHVGQYFPKTVRMYAVERAGKTLRAKSFTIPITSRFHRGTRRPVCPRPLLPSPVFGCASRRLERRIGARPSLGSRSSAPPISAPRASSVRSAFLREGSR